MPNNQLTPEFIRSVLNYDPLTGIMTWAQTLSNRSPKGSVVSYESDGRPTVRICGKLYRVSRVAWVIMKGEWPEHEIDHRDTDCANNKWSNLRAATRHENARNKKRTSRNTSGFKGVYWYERCKKWRAKIMCDGVDYHLGLFDDKDDARKAYEAAAVKLHAEFRRVS